MEQNGDFLRDNVMTIFVPMDLNYFTLVKIAVIVANYSGPIILQNRNNDYRQFSQIKKVVLILNHFKSTTPLMFVQ
jgi:hypothetical protein